MALRDPQRVEAQPREGGPDVRKPYASPALHVFGALHDITRHISTGTKMDGGAGAMSMS
jgi:hypothetical protein